MRYGEGLPVAGEYEGNFSNGGERVMEDAQGKVVLDLPMRSTARASGSREGFSWLRCRVEDPRQPTTWTLSDAEGGSPGKRPREMHPACCPLFPSIRTRCSLSASPPQQGLWSFASQDLEGCSGTWSFPKAGGFLDSLQFEIELGGTFPMRFQIQKGMLP